MTLEELMRLTRTKLYQRKRGRKVLYTELRSLDSCCMCSIEQKKYLHSCAIGGGTNAKERCEDLVRKLRGKVLIIGNVTFPVPKDLTV